MHALVGELGDNGPEALGRQKLRSPLATVTKEQREARMEDAMHTTRAAVEEGVPPNGGGPDSARNALPCQEQKLLGLSPRTMKTGGS
jgi:hypothetical protein